MDTFVYENEFEEKLLEVISKNFTNYKKKEYIFSRFMIINNISNFKDIKIKKFVDFVLETNNIPFDLKYKGIDFSLYSEVSQSVLNICNNWFFDIIKDSTNVSFIENNIKNIVFEAKNSLIKIKKTSFYKKMIILKSLELLNKQYKVSLDNNLNEISNLNYIGFVKKEYFEKILEKEINVLKKDINNIKILINEKQLENFLKYNLNEIEDGLKLIDCQYPINFAFIDILAKDKEGNIVIIELKITDDERLPWQCIYYPKQYKKEHPNENVRMISLCPGYSYYIKETLIDLNVEMLSYELDFDEDSNIVNIFISRDI